MPRSRLLADIALVLLLVVVLGGAVAVAQGFSLRDNRSPAAAPEVPDLRVLAVVDELAAEPRAPESTASLDAAAADLRWDLTVVEAPGTGYTAAPSGQPNVAGLLEKRLTSPAYDLVLVQAGFADYTSSPGKTGAAAIGVIKRIRGVVPLSTRIVLVGPLRPGPPEKTDPSVQEVLGAVAERERVLFLDPLADDWLGRSEGSTAGLSPLTDAERRQAWRRLAAELERTAGRS